VTREKNPPRDTPRHVCAIAEPVRLRDTARRNPSHEAHCRAIARNDTLPRSRSSGRHSGELERYQPPEPRRIRRCIA